MIQCLFDLRLFHGLHFPVGGEIIRSDSLDSLTWQVLQLVKLSAILFLFNNSL